MSYQETMEAAGATVLEFQSFGSYQGDWWAKVAFEGRVGWVTGSYGSCSGCDAFEGEFSYGEPHHHGKGYISESDPEKWKPDECLACQTLKEKFADFGRGYLDEIISQEEAEKKAAENLSWDSDAADMIQFIKSHPVETIN